MEDGMDAVCDNSFPLSLPAYDQLICRYDHEHGALWYYMNPKPRPCLTPTLLEEIRDLQQRVSAYLLPSPGVTDHIHYFIMASAETGDFKLRGDITDLVRLHSDAD